MSHEILVPDIGDFSEVDIIDVLVSPGDTVAVDDPLITLESDKASMDVPAPIGGTVVELKVQAGDKVTEGSLILTLDPGDDADSQTGDAPVAKPPEMPVAASTPGPSPDKSVSDPRDSSATGASQPGDNRVYASPSVRRIARERSVDLTQVSPTGEKGRITREDLEKFSAGGKSAPAAMPETGAAEGMAIPSIPAVDFSQFGEIEEKPLSRIQKLSGPFLHRAWLNVPMVTHHDEADTTDLESFRQSLKGEAEKKGVRVTALVFVMKALAQTMEVFPRFNSSLSPDGQSLIFKKYVHIGIAVDTPNGLVVPVFRDVNKKSIFALSEELGEISARARSGKLTPTDLSGGCISISSLGGIGGTAFTPIVNAPEVAILGVTRSRMTPVWNGKKFKPRLMTPLDLTYDHRVIDGAAAARFMVHLCDNLSDMRRVLL